jgi:protein-disulfide isomerase
VRATASRRRRLLGATVILLLVPGTLPVRAEPGRTVPVAEVDGEAITAEDLERALGTRLHQLELQIHELKRRQLDALIAERLLTREAQRRGIPVNALLDAEVEAKAAAVTAEEVDAVYQASRARLRGDEAAVREQLRARLRQQRLAARRAAYVEALRAQARVQVSLAAPAIRRVDVATAGAPVRGAADAPVTVVEFSDFHCPFCRSVQPTLATLLERYAGKVRLVHRDFPIDALHPQASRAAEAARCAHDQGRFWEYHDVLFATAPRAAPADLERYAGQVGLDAGRFGRCLSEATHRGAVQEDVDAAARLGLSGTPAFFVNGRLLSGAQPLESFVRLVEEELELGRAGRGAMAIE